MHGVNGCHHHCPPPREFLDTGNPRDLIKPTEVKINVFCENSPVYNAPRPTAGQWALSTFFGGIVRGAKAFMFGGGIGWGGFGGNNVGWGGFGNYGSSWGGGLMNIGGGNGNLFYDNTLGGQIYGTSFGTLLRNYQAPISNPTIDPPKTEEKKDEKTEEKKDPPKTEEKKDEKTEEKPKESPKVEPKIKPDDFNKLINGNDSGRITGSASTNDVSNAAGVDNLFAGAGVTTDEASKSDANQEKAENGFLKSFTVTDASGNVYTLTDPQVDEKTGKLTYKIDKAHSDWTGDDKGSNKNYEFNTAYNEGTRLEVKIEGGKVVLYNESGQPIARKGGGTSGAGSKAGSAAGTSDATAKNSAPSVAQVKSLLKMAELKNLGTNEDYIYLSKCINGFEGMDISDLTITIHYNNLQKALDESTKLPEVKLAFDSKGSTTLGFNSPASNNNFHL